MKLKHKDIIIDDEEPFLNCKLEREPYAVVLTDIVKNYSDGFVLAINNEWGTGKTTFVKMWERHLNIQKIKTLYFNAWENDFENDVLITLISELKELKEPKTEKIFKDIIHKAAPLAKSLSLGLIKTQIKKHVGNEFVNEALNLTSESIIDGLQEKIKTYTDRKNSIKAFKENLEKFVKQTTQHLPIVFIIDELDRCRPNYAVEVLEQIKHLFSVPGIVFVLSIDKIQLGHAIRGVYGSDNIDAEEYLRRFIDIEYTIPAPSTKLFCKYLFDYFQFKDFTFSEERRKYNELIDDGKDLIDFSASLFNYGKLPLRLQEKIFAHARLALCSFNTNHYVVPRLYIFLIYLKIKHHRIYNNIRDSVYSLQELVDKIEQVIPKGIKRDDLRIFIYTEAFLLRAYNNAMDYNQREPLLIEDKTNSKFKLTIISKLDTSKDNKILTDMLESFQRRYSNEYEIGIDHLVKKIDLIETIRQ